jgi:hypothetical protein
VWDAGVQGRRDGGLQGRVVAPYRHALVKAQPREDAKGRCQSLLDVQPVVFNVREDWGHGQPPELFLQLGLLAR